VTTSRRHQLGRTEGPLEGELEGALGAPVAWVGESSIRQTLVVLADEKAVRQLTPTIDALAGVDADAVIVTAKPDPGRDYGFVSRVFAPNLGIPEVELADDRVLVSGHAITVWGGALCGSPR
jgi:hypothetical protein